eukprot:Hpha_TRINITY_DN22524_c0_g1::TRINITY_DN22524_c0_g1_i1::g.185099::m.185099
MALRSFVLLSLLLAPGQVSCLPPPKVARPPKWGSDTLGDMVFVHGASSAPYTSEQLALLGKFSMVQFDKKQFIQSMPDASQEDRAIAAAQQVKTAHPDAQVLLYINGLIDFPASRLSNVTGRDPSLLLKNGKGESVKLVGHGVFDVRNPAMRKAFVADALYGMATSFFDGVFIDRANWCASGKCARSGSWDKETCESMVPAQRELFVELTAALGEGNITLAKETSGTDAIDWQVANGAMTSDTFCSHYCHGCNSSVSPASTWTKSDYQVCADSIATIANMSARGQLSQSHGMGPFDGPYAQEGRYFTMAAFLMGAGDLSYFSYANWAEASWEIAGTAWWPEYDKPLGKPTSPPNTLLPGKRWKYARNFSSGTTVYVDVATRVVDIEWGKAV